MFEIEDIYSLPKRYKRKKEKLGESPHLATNDIHSSLRSLFPNVS
jgi:hypothetical protein